MPYPEKPSSEHARQVALDSYEILDTLPETEFDDIVKLAAELCNVPVAQITFIDRDRQWMKATVGLDVNELPRAASFCGHAILDVRTTVVADATQDPRFADNPFVTGAQHLRFYAGAPLITQSGQTLGTLCVVDRITRELTPFQVRALETLRNQVITQLELRLRIRQEKRRNERKQHLRRRRAPYEAAQRVSDRHLSCFLAGGRGDHERIAKRRGPSCFRNLAVAHFRHCALTNRGLFLSALRCGGNPRTRVC